MTKGRLKFLPRRNNSKLMDSSKGHGRSMHAPSDPQKYSAFYRLLFADLDIAVKNRVLAVTREDIPHARRQKRFVDFSDEADRTRPEVHSKSISGSKRIDVSLPLFISVVSGTAIVVLIVVIYCTWRCWTSKRDQVSLVSTPEMGHPQYVMVGGNDATNASTAALKISQSTPDFVIDRRYRLDSAGSGSGGPASPGGGGGYYPDYIHEERQIGKQHIKTVIKQTTLPTLPARHQRFQRQLSHKLDFSNIEFTIHSMKYREQPAVTGGGATCATLLGDLRPELYRQNAASGGTGSADSSTAASKESIRVVGSLTFSLAFIAESGTLVVTVLRAENLPPKDFSGTSDPYAKIYLLPDRKRKFQTKVHRKTLNPEFNETFTFDVSGATSNSSGVGIIASSQCSHMEALSGRTLQFSLYDFDRFSRHDLIGVVIVRDPARLLQNANSGPQQETTLTMDIINVQQEMVDLGELMLSLCYLPTAGRLTVTIIKARNLKAMDITGTSDPYVKVALMCQGKRIKKRKTSVKRNTLNPVYNEAIVFDVPQENVEEVSLLIKVIDYDRVGSNELMGCFALGPQYLEAGSGRDHWFEMLENPRRPVAQWYTLQENMPPLPPPPPRTGRGATGGGATGTGSSKRKLP